ncbi:MAG: glycosyltransferase family 8 protein [Bacillota bacterium]|jgi:lipopolysaccharide biosynthesis glycosyltransferase
MNILVTLNANYIPQLIIMLRSVLLSNPGKNINVYIAHSSLTEEDFREVRTRIHHPRCQIINVKISGSLFKDAPATDRYPKEMYYRIFAGQYLPRDLNRILYLDPDLVVINPLTKLYEIDFAGNLFAAASHVKNKVARKINEKRLDMPQNSTYINSGVMMMNLELLRQEQNPQEVYDYIARRKKYLILPDQDVINGVYGNRTLPLDAMVYNLSDRYLLLHNINPKNIGNKKDISWIKRHTVIIHYCGRNKPWKENYLGVLGKFYTQFSTIDDIKEIV